MLTVNLCFFGYSLFICIGLSGIISFSNTVYLNFKYGILNFKYGL